MSILIKGMSMPTDCGHCKFFDYSWTDKRIAWCTLTENHITYVGEIESFCPLIEINEADVVKFAEAYLKMEVSDGNI